MHDQEDDEGDGAEAADAGIMLIAALIEVERDVVAEEVLPPDQVVEAVDVVTASITTTIATAILTAAATKARAAATLAAAPRTASAVTVLLLFEVGVAASAAPFAFQLPGRAGGRVVVVVRIVLVDSVGGALVPLVVVVLVAVPLGSTRVARSRLVILFLFRRHI